MEKRITAILADSLLSGEKLYIERAKKTLPYLVRQAKASQTIYYSDLAKELSIPNPRNLNYVLAAIGKAINELKTSTDVDIPPIQCIVINKSNNLPGNGVGWFISKEDFSKFNRNQQKQLVDSKLLEIYTFPNWDWVLTSLGLEPLEIDLTDELEKARNIHGGGESESHRKFKEFVSKNPSQLGLRSTIKNGELERKLPSGDIVDVIFQDRELKIGVEVKSKISNTADILRGIFQCVKYKHIIEAEQILNNQLPNSRVILVLESNFPIELTRTKNLLGIEVIDNIKIID